MGIASNAAALFPSPRVPSLLPREGTRGEGNKAAALEAMMGIARCESAEFEM